MMGFLVYRFEFKIAEIYLFMYLLYEEVIIIVGFIYLNN